MRWNRSGCAGWTEVTAVLFERSTSATKTGPLLIRRRHMHPSPGSPPSLFAQSSSEGGGSREPNRDGHRREVASTFVSVVPPAARPFPARTVPPVLLAGRTRSLFSESKRHSSPDAPRVRACRTRSAGMMRSADASKDPSLHRCSKRNPLMRGMYCLMS